MSESEETPPARPLLRIVRGDPSETELAALTAVVAAAASAGGGEEPEKPERTSFWADRAALVRRPLPQPGSGAWRASAWPR
ncbi:acetyl-CoA carboxylase biotin carboxyl carrier protein subunit [Amycolatopsis deserti]|uniref:Acetyl-CoA carboxylase biotin carboxyl carrier protein subunit n=1 Tax=Amycolatopsis deserti TaxID=185696 RepID=A0ABQ3JE85_9PSEU|nr:acyl-CoA carboxylase epsilon subunit [Amycolatopsis deserti]GHF22707.1 acetyl-CoA carboxylase biotin carboxyl carrier protein subunit [Amycolatopsis deserti]